MKILFILFALLAGHSYAQTLNTSEQLYVAIFKCDLLQMKKLLDQGADPEYPWNDSIGTAIRHAGYDNYTPLAFSLTQACPHQIDKVADNQKIALTIDLVKQMTSLLIKSGAQTEKLIPISYLGYSVPVSHIALIHDMSEWFGFEHFIHLVNLGANPNSLDSSGQSALRYTYKLNSLHQLSQLLDLGISFGVKKPDQSTHINYFPIHADPEELTIDLYKRVAAEGHTYVSTNYLRTTHDHPFFRAFTFLQNGGHDNDLQLFKKYNDRFDRSLYSLLIPTINMPAGPERSPVLGTIMTMVCPTIQFKDNITYSFSPVGGIYNNEGGQAGLLNQVYLRLLRLIQKENINWAMRDIKGRSILSYSLHLCPFEMTQEILKRAPELLTEKEISNPVFSFAGLKKGYNDIALFNNDHRTYEFLVSKGLKLENIDLTDFGVTNRRITSSGTRLPWQQLNSLGLSKEGKTLVSLQATYHIKKYNDIKRTVINIRKIKGKQTHHFKGKPLSVIVAKSENSSIATGYRVFDQAKTFSFELIDNNLIGKFTGGFEHTTRTSLNEFGPDSSPVIIIEETQSLSTTDLQITRSLNPSLSPGQVLNIDLLPSDSLFYDRTYIYAGVLGVQSCNLPICESLVRNKNSLSIDMAKLQRTSPISWITMNYLNSSHTEKLKTIENNSNNPQFIALMLDLIPESRNSQDIEISQALMNSVFNLELSGKLPFQKEAIIEKISQIEGHDERLDNFLTIRKEILTGNFYGSAFNLITQNFFSLKDYLIWMRSVSFIPKYKTAIDSFNERIRTQLGDLASRFELPNEEVEYIRNIL